MGIWYPSIFSTIVVDAVVRAVLLEFCGPQEVHHGLDWVAREHKIVLYADDVRIVVRKRIWVHMTLVDIVRTFDRV